MLVGSSFASRRPTNRCLVRSGAFQKTSSATWSVLYQRAFVAVGAIDEKVHVAACVGLVGLKGRVDHGGLTEASGLLHELERPVTVPLGLGLGASGRRRDKGGEHTRDHRR